MQQRIDYRTASPDAYAAMLTLERFVRQTSGLEPRLVELVEVRASQINCCAFCIDMHARDARAAGETEQRLYALAAWRHAPFFTERERAALAWTEALTRLADGPVSDELYDVASAQLTAQELVNLTLVCTTINGWNRLAVAFQQQPAAAAISETLPS